MIREKIKEYMHESGISQAALCKALDLKLPNFNAALQGARPMPYKDFIRTCEYLGLTIGVPGRANTHSITSVGQMIRNYITANGITTAKLKTLTGVQACSITSFMTGRRSITVNNLDKIATTLKLSLVKKTEL